MQSTGLDISEIDGFGGMAIKKEGSMWMRTFLLLPQ
jgi:hypothetical protein